MVYLVKRNKRINYISYLYPSILNPKYFYKIAKYYWPATFNDLLFDSLMYSFTQEIYTGYSIWDRL